MNKPVYLQICAAARSGSTISDMLLGNHSRAASLGELFFLPKSLAIDDVCSCGVPLKSCESWDKVFSRVLEETGVDMRRDPYALRQWDARAIAKVDHKQQTRGYLLARKLRLAWTDLRFHLPQELRQHFPLPSLYNRGMDNTFTLYRAIASAWDKDVLIDSSKNIQRCIALYERDPSHVRILFVTRDGRGSYLSRRTSGRSPKEAIDGWLGFYRRATALLPRCIPAEHLYQLRYEDLARNPAESLKQICGFLGVNYEEGMLDRQGRPRHMAAGNETRMSPNKPIQLDERWRTDMSSADRAFFEQHAGTVNRRLGYVD